MCSQIERIVLMNSYELSVFELINQFKSVPNNTETKKDFINSYQYEYNLNINIVFRITFSINFYIY